VPDDCGDCRTPSPSPTAPTLPSLDHPRVWGIECDEAHRSLPHDLRPSEGLFAVGIETLVDPVCGEFSVDPARSADRSLNVAPIDSAGHRRKPRHATSTPRIDTVVISVVGRQPPTCESVSRPKRNHQRIACGHQVVNRQTLVARKYGHVAVAAFDWDSPFRKSAVEVGNEVVHTPTGMAKNQQAWRVCRKIDDPVELLNDRVEVRVELHFHVDQAPRNFVHETGNGSGSTRTDATVVMKFVSPTHRGTT
jgi:hypothetical protein